MQEEEIDLSQHILVLYFYIPLMPFHKKLLYLFSQLEVKYKNFVCLAVDGDDFANQCIRFSVSMVPTVIILKDGQEIKRIEGSVKKRDVIDAFADIYSIDPINGE
jgi:thioredoxin-like negative regulator of GroEL